MWLGSFAVLAASSLLWWNEARTADTKRPNKGLNTISENKMEQAEYVPGEVLVKFRAEASSATVTAANTAAGGEPIKSFMAGASKIHHFKLGKGANVEDALAKYRQSAAVDYAEPNYLYRLTSIPNDTQFTTLWGLHYTGQSVNGTVGTNDVDIDAPEAWDITTGSANVIIGVVDSGIAYDHPDLVANMWKNPGEIPNDGIDNDGNGFVDDVFGYDFRYTDSEPMDVIDPNPSITDGNRGHGTHVAGTIGAAGNNSLGVTGVMQTAKLMALKAGGIDNGLTSAAIAQAISYGIANGARAFNASYGRTGGACSAVEYTSLSAANAAGVMFIAAAGNNNGNNDVLPNWPANYSVASACGPALPNVISVAAITQTGAKASFSSFGTSSVQIAAPGVNTNSTKPTTNDTQVLLHNFDSNPAGLGYTFAGANNSWTFTNTASFSAPTSLTDSPAGNYLNNTNSFATGPVFSIAGQRGCRLVSRLRLATENNFDSLLTDSSADGGITWVTQSGWSGSTGGAFLPFTLAELPDGKSNARFRFNFVSDGIMTLDGLYLDDVRVACTSGPPNGTTDYQFLAGTSMATPHVTGVVGLLLAANPTLTVAQIRNAILNTGDVDPQLATVTSTGRRLNARNAVVSVVSNFTVTVNKAGTGTGTVTSAPPAIDCGATCSAAFPSPGSVTLTATPTGSTFNGWTGGGCAGTGTCVVNTDATVTATFTAAPATAPAPAPPAAGGGGGGCTLAQGGASDGVLPILLLVTAGLLVWRSRRRLN